MPCWLGCASLLMRVELVLLVCVPSTRSVWEPPSALPPPPPPIPPSARAVASGNSPVNVTLLLVLDPPSLLVLAPPSSRPPPPPSRSLHFELFCKRAAELFSVRETELFSEGWCMYSLTSCWKWASRNRGRLSFFLSSDRFVASISVFSIVPPRKKRCAASILECLCERCTGRWPHPSLSHYNSIPAPSHTLGPTPVPGLRPVFNLSLVLRK